VDVTDVEVVDPRDGGRLCAFADTDGNTWTVQEIKARAERPLLPGPGDRQGRKGEASQRLGS
jgi:hypothetical protein